MGQTSNCLGSFIFSKKEGIIEAEAKKQCYAGGRRGNMIGM